MAAIDTQNHNNVNRTSEESFAESGSLAAPAHEDRLTPRLSISRIFGCLFEGDPGTNCILSLIDTVAVWRFTRVGLCNTIGIANPSRLHEWTTRIRRDFLELKFELHFHNTYGRGLVIVLAGLEAGVRRFDSCISGLGGCPFAPGATGNISREDLVPMLDANGVATRIDLWQLLGASDFLQHQPSTCINSNRWQVHHAQQALAAA
ncbi:MAG: hypothetical protein NVSMB6_15570 [Burkholderiaceae bacterium]